MNIQLIRSATLRVNYGGQLFIVDPFLAAKETLRPFDGKGKNPTVGLPLAAEEVVAGVEMAIISHLHVDHFDEAAARLLPKELPVFCQPGDEADIEAKGFTQVTPVVDTITWRNISLRRTPGRHGRGEWAERMGQVSGFIWQAAAEPTVYWMGDTIWYEEVAAVTAALKPDIIIVHASGARFGDSDPIIMDAEQTTAVCQAAPQATVIAVHLESLDHGTVTRKGLRSLAESKGISSTQLRIPNDGENLVF